LLMTGREMLAWLYFFPPFQMRNSCNAVPALIILPPPLPLRPFICSPTPKLVLAPAATHHGIALPPIIATLRRRRSLTLAASRRGGCWRGWIRASSAPSSPSPGSFSSSPDSGATYITRRDPAIRVVRSPEARPRAPGPPRRRAEDPGPAVHRGASSPAGAPLQPRLLRVLSTGTAQAAHLSRQLRSR